MLRNGIALSSFALPIYFCLLQFLRRFSPYLSANSPCQCSMISTLLWAWWQLYHSLTVLLSAYRTDIALRRPVKLPPCGHAAAIPARRYTKLTKRTGRTAAVSDPPPPRAAGHAGGTMPQTPTHAGSGDRDVVFGQYGFMRLFLAYPT